MPSRKRRRDATSAAEPLHSLQSKISNDPSTWASKPSPPNEDNTTTTQADDESIEEGEVALADDSDGVVSVGRKQKRPRLMQASGQSNADRRKLRRKQRELKGELIGLSDDVAEDEFHDYRERNNDLWGKVRYTREAGLDGDNVQIIAEKSAMKAEKLVTIPRYDAVRLAQCIVKKGTVRVGSSSRFNWRGLGFQVGVCFSALPPRVSFLHGPLEAEHIPKERKQTQRKKWMPFGEGEGEQPEDVDQTQKKESDGNELGAVQKHIKVIRKTLGERAAEKKQLAIERLEDFATQLPPEIDDEREIERRKREFIKANSQVDAVHCLFNPKSFTQTVENIFHSSFLVKFSEAGMGVRSVEEAEKYGGVPGPVIRPIPDEVNHPLPKQAIVRLDMKDWKDLCQVYNVEKSDVPHRVDGKVAKEKKGGKSQMCVSKEGFSASPAGQRDDSASYAAVVTPQKGDPSTSSLSDTLPDKEELCGLQSCNPSENKQHEVFDSKGVEKLDADCNVHDLASSTANFMTSNCVDADTKHDLLFDDKEPSDGDGSSTSKLSLATQPF